MVAMLRFLPVLTGFLLVASFPRIHQGYLAWVAWIPLLVFIFYSKSAARAFVGGFIAAAIEFFILFIWIPPVIERYSGGSSTVMAWVAYGLMVSILACYPAIACALTKRLMVRGGNSFLLLLPAIWVLLEFAQSVFPFGGLPWLLAGYSQTGYLPIMQMADITGVYGISFLILWTNTAIAFLFLRVPRRAAYVPALVAGVALAAGLLYGSSSLRRWGSIPPVFSVAMLQGNILFEDSEAVQVEKFRKGYRRMADSLKNNIDLLILPESPTPVLFQYDTSYRQELGNLAARYPLGLVFNNIDRRDLEGEGRYFNSAFFLDGNGMLKGIYDKMHLVPFGEYFPFKHLFFFTEIVSKDVGEFHAGRDFRIVEIGNHPSNAIICFEAVFPSLVRRFVEKGSQLIVNLTNDGWYGRSVAPYQHLEIARWRAVENRRYLLRATNSGFSAVIEPTGNIQSATGLMQEGICEGRFAFISEKTIYTRYGNILVFLCAIISIGSAILAELRYGAFRKRQLRRNQCSKN
jgi:apolipoprotein N-acyltransferase